MNTDDLFYKIGRLTVENDILHVALTERDKKIEELEQKLARFEQAEAGEPQPSKE